MVHHCTSMADEAGEEPLRYDYPTKQDYLVAWKTWRAVKRDWDLPQMARDQLGILLNTEAMAKHGYTPEQILELCISVLGEDRYTRVRKTEARIKMHAVLMTAGENGMQDHPAYRVLHKRLYE